MEIIIIVLLSMLIILANELDTTVSELLGELVAEPTTDDLKILSEKLEVINLQLAKRSITKVKTIRWILISLCAVIVVIFIALASTNSFYLNWNYNDPELAVAGTILHGFEFLFVRLAPIVFLTSVVGVVLLFAYQPRPPPHTSKKIAAVTPIIFQFSKRFPFCFFM